MQKLCINCIHRKKDKDKYAELLDIKPKPGVHYGYSQDGLYKMKLEHHCEIHGSLLEKDSSPDLIYMPEIDKDSVCTNYRRK